MKNILLLIPSKSLIPKDIENILKAQKVNVCLPDDEIHDSYRWKIYWKVKPEKLSEKDISDMVFYHEETEFPYHIFEHINEILESEKNIKITLNTNLPIYYFTDGSCVNNGKKNSAAGFGLIIYSRYRTKTIVSGKVLNGTYKFDRFLTCDEKLPIKPSNNRGELLGILFALLSIQNEFIGRNIKIVSDSEYAIKTLNIWYESHKKKDTTESMKNIDLIEICMKLKNEIKIGGHSVEFIHCKAHQKEPKSNSYIDRVIFMGNRDVDNVCKEAVTAKGLYRFEGETILNKFV